MQNAPLFKATLTILRWIFNVVLILTIKHRFMRFQRIQTVYPMTTIQHMGTV